MKTQTKIYIAAGIAVVFAIALVSYGWSSHKVAKLESAVAAAKAEALKTQEGATAIEIEAGRYEQKIDYLETKLTEINQLARKQDEELKQLNNSSRGARGDAEHARRTRSITTTGAQLCEKLAELDHPCD